jgi:transposase
MVLPPSSTKFRTLIVNQLEAEQGTLTSLSPEVFWHLYDEFLTIETRLASDDEKRTAMGRAHPACHRLQTVPGIGPVSATEIIAAISDATQFRHGCPLAAWLGLVPWEHSTAGKLRLLGMSPGGDRSLRQLVVHGARATLHWVDSKPDDRSQWLKALITRRGKHRAAVA